jgi:hypothetical protein
MAKRITYNPHFKKKVVLAALKENKTLIAAGSGIQNTLFTNHQMEITSYRRLGRAI